MNANESTNIKEEVEPEMQYAQEGSGVTALEVFKERSDMALRDMV